MAAKLLVVLAGVLAAIGLIASVSPASARTNGSQRVDVGVGYFYGTFNEDPNILMLVGGRAEDFCAANPEDPFGAEPGSATARIKERSDGTVKIKVNSRHQPFHLYASGNLDGPPWIGQVCADYFATGQIPDPWASGTARLKARITDFGQGNLDIFNTARGKAVTADGTKYRVRASADFEVRNGDLMGNPEDFVKFSIREVGGKKH